MTNRTTCFAIGSLCLADAGYHLHEALDNFSEDQILAEIEHVANHHNASEVIEVLWQLVHDNLYERKRREDHVTKD